MATIDTSSGRYRIAEVASLSGFTPSTLRYYEQAGVLSEPVRTPAGYRLYDDRDLERLRLIARAKDLGCTLEEITELVQAWEADDCGPVKHRLGSLVHEKVRAVQAHLAEQAAFAAQLQETAAALAARPVDGPCDDSCGCTTAEVGHPAASDVGVDTADAPAHDGMAEGSGDGCGCGPALAPAPEPVHLAQLSDPDGSEAPIACSLQADDMGTRVDEWQAVLADVKGRRDRPGGLRLEFDDDAPLAELTRLAAAEQACCPFFGFAITIDGRGVALEVTAPADGQDLLSTVFGVSA